MDCAGYPVAIHTVPADTCYADSGACGQPDDPIVEYLQISSEELTKSHCCPACA